MNHLFKMLVAFFVSASLAGCGNTRQEPEIKGIKIGELAPPDWRAELQVLRTTNIDVTTFELPAANVKSLDDIWRELTANADLLRYTDAGGFAANGLRVAAGGFDDKAKVTESLESMKARKLFTTSFLISNGQAETLPLGRLTRKTTVSYIGRTGAIENAQVGPALLGLQIYARQLPGSTSARVQVTPVILSSTEGLAPELAQRLKETDLLIYSAGFGLNMKPGDIIVLGPSQFSTDVTTAAGRFFTKPEPNPTITVLLMVCTSIT